MRAHLFFALSLILFPIAVILYVGIAFAQGEPPAQIDAKVMMDLYQLLGWPGAIAGAVVVGLGIWRKMAPNVWDSWPRWARFALGFLAPALASAAMGLISGGLAAWPTAIALGIGAGVAAIFSVETAKSVVLKSRTGKRIDALRLPIDGPGGTRVKGS